MVHDRRAFLFALTAACSAQTVHPPQNHRSGARPSADPVINSVSGKGRVFPSSAVRYADPATEAQVIRLTDPHFSSRLASNGNRVLTNRALLYSSDMAGSEQAFWMELRNRAPRQVTDAAELDPGSLALSPDGRQFWHFDGGQLSETNLANPHRTREVYRVADGFHKTSGAAVNETGTHAAFVETGGGGFRLRLVDLNKGTAATVTESADEILDPLFRPRSASLIYRVQAGYSRKTFWSIHFDGSEKRTLPLPEDVPHAQWSADGATLLYLNRPEDRAKLTTLEEFTPETSASAVIANTSQFVSFAANANSSVIAGASGSKASPYVLLLIRAARRELTLAEHRASDATTVAPRFSPNSQFLVFGSDRHGKPAIYWMPVDKLVSETDSTE